MEKLGFHCHDLDDIEARIIANGLRRGEFYDLDSSEIPRLKKIIASNNLAWSIHAPLVKLDWYPDPPTWSFLCDPSPERRSLTMKMVTLTVQQAATYGADYVVVHFPTPSGLAPGESEERLPEIADIARASCEQLAELSQKLGVPVHIEGVGLSPLLSESFLTGLLKEFTPLRYCFDLAHTYLAALNDGFDYYRLAESVRPYLGSVHVWNTRGQSDYRLYRHIAVHPSQKAEDGWVDVPRVLRCLGADAPEVKIVFESEASYPQALGGYDYREGIRWVRSLLDQAAVGRPS